LEVTHEEFSKVTITSPPMYDKHMNNEGSEEDYTTEEEVENNP
jgi:hypothetical protein